VLHLPCHKEVDQERHGNSIILGSWRWPGAGAARLWRPGDQDDAEASPGPRVATNNTHEWSAAQPPRSARGGRCRGGRSPPCCRGSPTAGALGGTLLTEHGADAEGRRRGGATTCRRARGGRAGHGTEHYSRNICLSRPDGPRDINSVGPKMGLWAGEDVTD